MPEPEIAAASGIADEPRVRGRAGSRVRAVPVDLPAGTVPADAATSGAPSSDAPLAGEVLTGELEADPEPVDDATAEMVLEPIADGDDDLRLPEPAADGAVDSAVVDAESRRGAGPRGARRDADRRPRGPDAPRRHGTRRGRGGRRRPRGGRGCSRPRRLVDPGRARGARGGRGGGPAWRRRRCR
ncbi:hypothetical protein [Clavibacter tessellarius]|uniref:hypothetical protein n=1 Tax=Clavibacter tessellarius TaxID=31965 RepID=UPI00324A4D17